MDWRIVRRETVGSTMDEAAALGREGVPEGTVVVARHQNAGRGRAGRRWAVPSGTALQMTVILRPEATPDRLGPLPLLIGVAVSQALEAVAPRLIARLKWPNDVLVDGKKIGGILVTSRSAVSDMVVLVGIGINVTTAIADLPENATSLVAASHAGAVPNEDVYLVECVMQALLPRIAELYAGWQAESEPAALDCWSARAVYLGERVTVVDGSRTHAGTMVGVDEDGALLLRDGAGDVRRVVAGDLTRGPVPAVPS